MLDDILYHIAFSLAFAFLHIQPPHKLITTGARSWEFDGSEGLGSKKRVKVTIEVLEPGIAFVENETYAGAVGVPKV